MRGAGFKGPAARAPAVRCAMRVPERLVEVWAAGADGRGHSGSGWVVGESGVVTCRHVLDPYLTSVDGSANRSKGDAEQPVIQIRQAGRSSPSDWVDCTIAWQHPTRDLVLLQITPRSGQSWDSPKDRLSRLAEAGQLPSACIAIGFPDAAAGPSGLRDSEQAPGRLHPAAAARDPNGLIPFDVDISVPDDAALWGGFSGSAVVDQQTRLVGLIAKAHPGRQQRRLLVVPIEDAAGDPGFAAAAAAVGLDPIVEDYQAPLWRQSVEPRALIATGVPLTVADVEDLKVFGVHGPSSAATRSSYVDYVKRDKDRVLEAALLEARSGGRRIVLILGDSAAGKSRSASEAVRRDPVLRRWRLVVPLADGGLARLANADLGWRDTVLWLDDLDKYLARGLDLGTLRRVLGDNPTVVVVATMRTIQLRARQSELADPAWGFLTDDSEVTRVDLEASFSDDEVQAASAKISDTTLLGALHDGAGLGEWLVAGPELMKRLNDGQGLDRAFADTVISWYRTGLNQPLAKEEARRLWIITLPQAPRQRLLSREPGEQSKLFDHAAAWACQPVIGRDLYEQALITKSADGYVAHSYVVDQTERNPQRPPVPDPVWQQALQFATTSPESGQKPGRIWAVANAAYLEHALACAMTAMQTLAQAGDASALSNVGVLLGELGRREEAAGVYDQVVARFGEAPEPALREQVAKALFNKGVTLGQLGRSEEEAGVYDQVVARFGGASEPALCEQVAKSLVNKGVTLGQLGRREEAAGVYEQVVARFGDAPEPALRERVATALVYKGVTLGQLGRREEAAGVYDQVVARFGGAPEPALRERVATALFNKGVTLGQLGRREEAAGVYDQVVARFGGASEPALREQVAKSLVNKGVTLGQLGRREEAAGVYDQVVARFGGASEPALRERVAKSLVNKGVTLGQLGRREEAAGVYDQVVARFGGASEPALREQVATALVNKGVTLGQLGRAGEEAGVYDQVVARFGDASEPALREQVATALVNKGVTLGQLGQREEAAGVYDQVVARFGDASEPALREQVATALVYKGVTLGRLGRAEEAAGVYDQVVARFGDASEPALREQVATALRMKAEIEGGPRPGGRRRRP